VEISVRPATLDDAGELIAVLAELSQAAEALDPDVVAARLADERVRVLVGHLDGRVLGTASLCVLVTVTEGLIGHVEDVVVTAAARGSGLGRRLVEALHVEARALGIRKLELTSRPSREAANRLYQSLGYERRETNVYRLRLD